MRGTMSPAQVLAHADLLQLFSGIHFLGLHASERTIRTRIGRRHGIGEVRDTISTFLSINDELAATDIPNLTVIDADRSIEAVESDVRQWIAALLDDSTTPA